jgi:hypothetical protein
LYEVPVLWSAGTRRDVCRAKTDEEFLARVAVAAPELTLAGGFDWAGWGLVLAGGSVAALLMTPGKSAHNFFDDYDFFMAGHANDTARSAAITALGDHLLAGHPDMKVGRTQSSVTFTAGPRKYQVVLRAYSTLAEVVHGFDMGSCAYAFDGTRVWMSLPGVLAAERGCNVLCLQARRRTYETRLSKYFRRGYDVVLPDFDLAKYRGTKWSDRDLPYLSFNESSPLPAREWAIPCYHIVPCWGPEVLKDDQDYENTMAVAAPRTGVSGAPATEERNLRALLASPPRTGALFGQAPYSLGMDLATIRAPFAQAAASAIAYLDTRPNLHLSFGKQGYGFLDESSPATMEDLRLNLRARLEALLVGAAFVDGALIPSGFRSVEDGTLLTIAASPHAVTLLQWYGNFLYSL